MGIRTLLLMRHAKSEYPPGVPDRDRPLAPRGERDAVAAGTWLRAAYPAIDLAVVSPARRARETWSHVSTFVEVAGVHEDDRIYDDWGARLGDVVVGLPAEAMTALIIGHNPGIEDFTATHARVGPPRARERMMRKFPTCAIAVIHIPHTWAESPSSELSAFAVPRG